jgi:hypothetical protein
MGALEKTLLMKKQGISEMEIVENLKQEGISPREIADAISQSRIKDIVSQGENNPISAQEDFQLQDIPQNQEQNNYTPQQNYTPEEQFQTPAQEYQENPYAQQQGNYPTNYSSGYEANTMIEIAEQVFQEKIQSISKKMEELNEMKTLATTKLENISDRLKRIESVIDKIQVSIIEEVSNYGRSVSNLKKEVEMVEDSFSKIINPLAEKAEHHHVNSEHHTPSAHHTIRHIAHKKKKR